MTSASFSYEFVIVLPTPLFRVIVLNWTHNYYIPYQETLDMGVSVVDKRAEYHEKIHNNIECIVADMEELDQSIVEIRRHVAMNDAFFLFHLAALKDPCYGSEEDLVELFLDTCS